MNGKWFSVANNLGPESKKDISCTANILISLGGGNRIRTGE